MAIFLQGGVGGGNFSQGYPPLVHFLNGLSERVEITVYSVFPPNPDFRNDKFKVESPGRRITNPKLRTVLLMTGFMNDHLVRKYDIVHAFWVYPAGTVAVLLGKLLRIPSVVTVQGGEAAAIKEIGYGNMLKPWLKRITLLTCENATVLNSISRFLLSQLSLHGLKRSDGVVTPFGPDISHFSFRRRQPSSPLRLIHVANLTEVKDQDTILRAVKILSEKIDVRLQVVGADYLNGYLQQRCIELAIERFVEFTGPIPQSELPRYYGENRIMVHTSLHEGQSGVIGEAMASGVVVCATPVGIVYDLGHEYFKIIPFGDSDALAAAIRQLISDPEQYERLQKACLAYVKSHDAGWTQNAYYEMYKNTISKRK